MLAVNVNIKYMIDHIYEQLKEYVCVCVCVKFHLNEAPEQAKVITGGKM